MSKRAALVEDDLACADAMRGALQAAGWSVEHFATGREAVDAAKRAALPPVVLMDLALPGEDSFDILVTLAHWAPNTAIVAVTGHAGDDFVFRALRSGAVGYVLKNDALQRLAQVVDEVASGGAPMSPSIARRVIASFQSGPAKDGAERPTPREIDVLACLARGLSYAESADALAITVDTIRAHVRKTYSRLQVASKAEAVATAIRHGWIE